MRAPLAASHTCTVWSAHEVTTLRPSGVKAALPKWLETTPKERSELLHKLADVIDENAEELAQLESLNVGKPLMASRDEMPFSADNLRFFAGAARQLEGKASELVSQGQSQQKSNIGQAKTYWRTVLKMVPSSSPNYTKAYSLLNSASAPNIQTRRSTDPGSSIAQPPSETAQNSSSTVAAPSM